MNFFKEGSYPGEGPARKLEASFPHEKPTHEVAEDSSAEYIVSEVLRRHQDAQDINPLHFFRYRGFDLKLGDLKNLGKLMYEIQKGKSRISGRKLYATDDIEKSVGEILQEIDEMPERA